MRGIRGEIAAGILAIDHPYRTDKPVPLAHNGLNKARFSGIVTQRSPKFPHDVVDVPLGVDEQIRAPKFLDDVLARHHSLSPPDQENQQFHGLFLELHGPSKTAQFVAPQVELNFDFATCSPCTPHKTSRPALSAKFPLLATIHKRYTKFISSSL